MLTPNVNTLQHAGEYGNQSVAIGKVTFEADAAGAVADILQLPPGITIVNARMVNDALGATTTIALGYRFKDPNDGSDDASALIAATGTATAGNTVSAAKSVEINGGPIYITAILAGAAATGDVEAIIEYVYNGA